MGALRDFVAEVLEIEGSAVEAVEPDGLEVLAPEPLRAAMGWPELVRLGFGAELPVGATAVGFEGDWLDRFGALLGDRGRWAERQFVLPGLPPRIHDPSRLLDHAIEFPNAVFRLQEVQATWTRCLLLAFRTTAVSDEKREGLIWLGFNQGTGAVIDDFVPRLRDLLSADGEWQVPEAEARLAAGPAWEVSTLERRVTPLLRQHVRREVEPFLRTMRRRLDRDRNRIHQYHSDLHLLAQSKLAALAGASGEKADNDRKREMLRIAAIEREYAAKLGDLRHNYALRVSVEWVQGLQLFVPVQRFHVLVKRRKGEKLMQLDWHPSVRLMEPPPSDWGLGNSRSRLVCDDQLHITEPAAQAPCPSCGKAWCRACHPSACPRCGEVIKVE
jgi:predicted RNA-binding Zn-ribbon protein involved in translation (DUF1610 family)